jgi:hypothetical protein
MSATVVGIYVAHVRKEKMFSVPEVQAGAKQVSA